MATYIVFTKESTQDQSELNTYQSKVRKTLEGHPIKLLAAYGPQQALEGPAHRTVIGPAVKEHTGLVSVPLL
jgi:uncharacterized protein (DUF1330 family)